MAITTIGLFENTAAAQQAITELKRNGFDEDRIYLLHDKNDLNRWRSLPDGDVKFYREFLNRESDSVLVLVQAAQNNAQKAAEILANPRYGAINPDLRNTEYREQGYTDASLREYSDHDITLPVIEEEMKVGKRTVERGRMRIYTEVTEVPVEEQVTLREEHVSVDRRPVNRAVTDADMDALADQDRVLEIRETAEEAVISKQARVVEEVTIDKDVTERTETIRDTVKRTDVEIREIEAERAVNTDVTAFETYDKDFRSYYDSSLRNSGYTYDQYQPAFRYGYTIANDANMRGHDWKTIEPRARDRWEERNPNTWEQFKDTVQHAWNKVRS